MQPTINQTSRTFTLNYSLCLTDGTILSQGQASTLRADELAPFLLETLCNQAIGTKVSQIFKASDAFGNYDPLRYLWVERRYFPEDFPLTEGQIIEFDHEKQSVIGKVLKIQGQHLAIDLNHPLAGQDLHWQAEILALSGASQ